MLSAIYGKTADQCFHMFRNEFPKLCEINFLGFTDLYKNVNGMDLPGPPTVVYILQSIPNYYLKNFAVMSKIPKFQKVCHYFVHIQRGNIPAKFHIHVIYDSR